MRVAALMTLDGNVVLVRHRRGSETYHLLPGGGVDWGESLEEALVREVAEETGLSCTLGRPLLINDTIFPDGTRHVVNITFACTPTTDTITTTPADARVEAVDLVPPQELERIDLRPPIARELMRFLSDDAAPTIYAGSVFTPE